jgi:ribose transport system permease protein
MPKEAASVTLATIVLIVVISIIHPDFGTPSQLVDVLQQAVYVGILAAGMSFLLSMREIDLSVGSTFALTLIIGAVLMRSGWNPWMAAVVMLAVGGGIGAINAFLIQVVRIPSLIATLAMLALLRGLTLALADGQQVVGLPVESSFFSILGEDFVGLPVSVWILLALVAALTVVMRMTPFGYRVREIGSNPEAAAFSGVPIARVRVTAFVLTGVLAGIAGILGLAFFTSGDPGIGTGFELSAIAAAVIGGTPLRGGTASVVGAAIGAVLLSVVTSGLAYFDIPANWSQFATGAVILAAVSLDSLARNRRRSAGPGLAL